MTIHKSERIGISVVIFLLPKITRKPKDKLWLNAEEQDFGLPKVLIDNSTAVEGLEKLLLFSIKKTRKNCWIISMCCMWH
jgi:hypothetical protein